MLGLKGGIAHKGFTKIIDFVLVIYQLTCNREMGKAAKISKYELLYRTDISRRRNLFWQPCGQNM